MEQVKSLDSHPALQQSLQEGLELLAHQVALDLGQQPQDLVWGLVRVHQQQQGLEVVDRVLHSDRHLGMLSELITRY